METIQNLIISRSKWRDVQWYMTPCAPNPNGESPWRTPSLPPFLVKETQRGYMLFFTRPVNREEWARIKDKIF